MGGRTDSGAPIIVRAYDLCAELYEHVNRFPRAQRALLGRVILDEALRMLTALTLANRLSDKREALAEASGRLDALRVCLRLAKRLGFLSRGAYAGLAEVADEVGRMLGGWIKHERGRQVEARESDEPEPALRRAGPAQWGAAAPTEARPETAAVGQPQPAKGAVRYTMRSPLVERYLAAKLVHPGRIVLVSSGAFYGTFFEDATTVGRELGLRVRDLAAESEPEKIFTCGIPKARLEAAIERLRRAGWEAHVE